jgi:glycosyltransferase involved in cell wall biosynthesis
MKILMVLETLYPPDERVENEINILTDKGFKVTLVCTLRGSKLQVEEEGNLKILRIPVSTCIYKSGALALIIPIYFLFWYIHLNGIIKKSRFDAIHLHDLPLVKVGLRLSRKYKIPLVCDYHENRPEIMKMYSHVYKFPGKWVISIKQWLKYQQKYTKKADRLILVTEEARDYYVSNYNVNPEKVIILPNYILLKRFRTFNTYSIPQPVSKEYFTATYFGDTGIRRGTQTILESAALLKESSIQFLIIGDSRDQDYLKKKAEECKLSNVKFTGRISVAEAISLINRCDIGLCPFLRNIHHDTTYANKMFQYMALGKPVIVSNCTAQANFVDREGCGLVFEAGNPGDLASKIVSLTDSETYHKLSNKAINCVNGNYNWETTGSRLINMYLESSFK